MYLFNHNATIDLCLNLELLEFICEANCNHTFNVLCKFKSKLENKNRESSL